LGAEHPDTLTSMGNLASIYLELGRVEEGAKLNEEVLEARKRILGAEHPDTLTSMGNLASIYLELGRVEEGAKLNEEVLEARKRILGAEHPDTLISMGNLASSYMKQGRVEHGTKLDEVALEGWKRILGEEPPETLRRTMARLLKGRRRDENQRLKERALARSKNAIGENHSYVLTAITHPISVAAPEFIRHTSDRVTISNVFEEIEDDERPTTVRYDIHPENNDTSSVSVGSN
jgi:tetratricopeptide (TPR) repeat protein